MRAPRTWRAEGPAVDGDQPRILCLGYESPILVSGCDRILGAARSEGQELDLSDVVVVVPGERAGRNLHSMLVEQAACRHQALTPPAITTPGGFVESVMDPPAPVAGRIACLLAWVEALRAMPQDRLGVLIRRRADHDDLTSWLALARLLDQMHEELAGEGLRFGDVPSLAVSCSVSIPDPERWAVAAEIQARFESALEAHGMVDVRLWRIGAASRCRERTGRWRVFVLAAPDMPGVTRQALRAMGSAVTVLVQAPAAMRDRFDDVGCVIPGRWSPGEIRLRDEDIVFANTPAEQAELALEAVARVANGRACDDVVLGVPDESVVPYLERRAEQLGTVRVRDAAGIPLVRSVPWRLLEAVGAMVESYTVASLRALACQPDAERYVHRWLRRRGIRRPWLSVLDAYMEESFHQDLAEPWATDDAGRREVLEALAGAVRSLLGRRLLDGRARSPARWGEALLGLFERALRGRRVAGDSPQGAVLLDACAAMRDVIDDLRGAGDDWPSMSASTAIRLVMSAAAERRVPYLPDSEAVEMLGWLELASDPASVAVVTGMNEGIVPQAHVRWGMLPDGVREAMGLPCHARRLARDVYVLMALVEGRERVVLIAGRRNAQGEACWPSRLVLGDDPDVAATRLGCFLGRACGSIARVSLTARIAPGRISGFRVRPMAGGETPNRLPVTAFRDYLRSPYLFYLRHVLGLRTRGDVPRELDRRAFGALVHEALRVFAQTDAAGSDDERRVREALRDALHDVSRRQFGARPPMAVRLQVRMAERRLAIFARLQVQRARAGWRIVASEWSPPAARPATFDVDGVPVVLTGRIDRIERNEATKEWAIFDYKTGRSAQSPETEHRTRDGRWRDLQLPLYRHLARPLGLTDAVRLGYIRIPPDPTMVRIQEVRHWTAEVLADADEAARDVVRDIRAGEFAEVGEGAPEEEWILGALCGTGLVVATSQTDGTTTG